VRMMGCMRQQLGFLAGRVDRGKSGLIDPRKRVQSSWEQVDGLVWRLSSGGQRLVVRSQSRADGLREKLLYRNPHKRVEGYALRVSRLTKDLGDAVGRQISERESRVGQLVSDLDNLSPLAILKRGYSITRKYPSDELVKDAQEVAKGDRVRVKFYRGEILCEVEECGLP